MPCFVQVSWAQFIAPNSAWGPCCGRRYNECGCPNEGGCSGGCGCGGSCGSGCGCGGCGDGHPPGAPPVRCVSCRPVRYATGELILHGSDLHANGFGTHWGHVRSFANRLPQNTNVGNGYNWQVMQWPYLLFDGFGSVTVMGQANYILVFDPADGGFVPRFKITHQNLVLDSGKNVYDLVDLDGSIWQFNATTGVLIKQMDPAGNTLAVIGCTANGFNFTEVQRSYTDSNGNTTVESFLYQYDDPSSPSPLLLSVTLRRRVNAGAWNNIEQAVYTYYGSCDPNGGPGDLKTVVTQMWENGAWVSTGTTYYRYWLTLPGSSSSSSSHTSGTSPSSSSCIGANAAAHLVKYVVNPAAYARLSASTDPLTAPDSVLAGYADYYFAYDANGRCTLETVDGGTQTFAFAYVESDNDQDYNSWTYKTTETLPDGNQNIVYANFAGLTMLHIFQSGSDQWLNFHQYDENANMVLHGNPSAVNGYSETYADLLNNVNGQYQYLNNNTGLIELYQYHLPTGYLTGELIQQGQLGCPIWLRQYQYVACTGCCGSSSSSTSSAATAFPPTYFLSAEILFPVESTCPDSSSSSSSSGQLRQIITTYSYIWNPGTCQVQQRTTTLPVISAAQNGSGVANTRLDYYDFYANLTWHMDEAGFITHTGHDVVTSAIIQRIDDVDTTQEAAPPGWVTPSGGGLNLITDYTIDDEGRATQMLGPWHTIDIGGVPTSIRRATWTVFQDGIHQTWAGQGYATGTAPNYAYSLVNPVAIRITDPDGKLTDQVQATRGSSGGALQPTDSFPQSSYVRWTTQQYTDGYHLSSRRVYKLIPPSGTGTGATNYDETGFGYDVIFRQNRNVTPGGTVTRAVFDPRNNPASIWVGTNDNGATDSDPTGGGAPGNNMVEVNGNQYDNAVAGADNNLTQTSQFVDSSTVRVTNLMFDWRNRHTDTQGEIDFYQKTYLDNLDRVVMVERYDTSLSGKLIARTTTNIDDLSRVFQVVTYGVDPTTGAVGNRVVDSTWYDARGRRLMESPAGSQLLQKFVYDGPGRVLTVYLCYAQQPLTYGEAQTIANDIVLEQLEQGYDQASNLIQTTTRRRYHKATGAGSLTFPGGAEPLARVSYAANYYDALGRLQAGTDFGTNGGVALVRPNTIPARADEVLVTSILYNDAGELESTTDPAGTLTCFAYDSAAREVQRIMNCTVASSSSSSSSTSSLGTCPPSFDTNITLLTSYNADGNVAQVIAVNSQTGNQVTQYIYGTSLASSGIASGLLRVSEIYPDSVAGSDQVVFTYNRQAEIVTRKDQAGTVHEYDYDLLGRQDEDRVTTLGGGIDGAVLRIELQYEVRGMLTFTTSYDNATVGHGSIVNQVQRTYNDFGQLTVEYQSHTGAVNTGTTPSVQYSYADGNSNTIRPTVLTYPNGRVMAFAYGPSGQVDDVASRLASLIDSDGITSMADYSYLGLNGAVILASSQPGFQYTLLGSGGGIDPDTGDIYKGLDRFSRRKDLLCSGMPASSSSSSSSSGSAAVLEEIKYGYDRVSNRLYRFNAADPFSQHDELYESDGVYRLKEFQRGTLNAAGTALIASTFAQCWSLDETGNWSNFREADTGNGNWNLVQARTSSQVNEISSVVTSTGPQWAIPSYSAVGNMASAPMPGSESASLTLTHDAWNRLVQISTGAGLLATSQFDGVHRRSVKNTYASGVLNSSRHYYYSSSWQILEERLGTSSLADRQLVWSSAYIDQLVLRDRDTTGTGTLDERLYAIQDATSNVTAVVDMHGVVQERYGYNAYGMPIFRSPAFATRLESSFDWNILFCGSLYDAETALFRMRSRTLHPTLGCWLERDPVEGLETWCSPNLYTYACNSPTNLTDPLGLQVPAGAGPGVLSPASSGNLAAAARAAAQMGAAGGGSGASAGALGPLGLAAGGVAIAGGTAYAGYQSFQLGGAIATLEAANQIADALDRLVEANITLQQAQARVVAAADLQAAANLVGGGGGVNVDVAPRNPNPCCLPPGSANRPPDCVFGAERFYLPAFNANLFMRRHCLGRPGYRGTGLSVPTAPSARNIPTVLATCRDNLAGGGAGGYTGALWEFVVQPHVVQANARDPTSVHVTCCNCCIGQFLTQVCLRPHWGSPRARTFGQSRPSADPYPGCV